MKTDKRIVLALGILVLALVACGGTASVTPTPAANDFTACVMAQVFVEQQLKAPGTAKFQLCKDATIRRSGDQFTVRSYVDSQNSFGAMLRMDYVAVVEWTGGDNWRLVDLAIGP